MSENTALYQASENYVHVSNSMKALVHDLHGNYSVPESVAEYNLMQLVFIVPQLLEEANGKDILTKNGPVPAAQVSATLHSLEQILEKPTDSIGLMRQLRREPELCHHIIGLARLVEEQTNQLINELDAKQGTISTHLGGSFEDVSQALEGLVAGTKAHNDEMERRLARIHETLGTPGANGVSSPDYKAPLAGKGDPDLPDF